MARRIGRNREVLGLHFPSDTKGGEDLAALMLPRLLACPSVKRVKALALNEWENPQPSIEQPEA